MNGFSEVSYKTRVYEKTFQRKTEIIPRAVFTRTSLSMSGRTPLKRYEANGDTYLYLSDKSLVKVNGNTVTDANFTSDVAPLVLPVIVGGANTTLFINDLTAKAGAETITGVPYGTSCAFCAGRLFIASGKEIKYSEEFDFTDFSVGLSFGGFLKTDAADGDVVFLAEDKGKLIALCEHAAYIISPYGEEYEFTMEKISSFALNVVKNSAFKAGNRICFISGDDFCLLTGGKIKRAGEKLATVAVSSYGGAGGKDGFYVIPLSVGTKRYVYVYDTVKDAETLDLAIGYTVCGVCAVKTGDDKLYDLSVSTDEVTATEPYSAEYDFGSCAKKSVCRVEVHASGSAEMLVRGDGFFRAAVTERCNEFSCFVHGRKFTIEFLNASADFKIDRLTVHYIIYGE